MSHWGAAPSDVDLTEDRRVDIVATSVLTWALALIAVVLRVLSRQLRGVPLWFDDWLIFASLVPSCAHVLGIAGYAVSRGLGRHIWVTPRDARFAWAVGLFVAELGYFLTLTCVKWSILAFYWRSFNIRRSIKGPIFTLSTVILLWCIAVIIVTLIQCRPVSAWWARFDPTAPLPSSAFHCDVDSTKFFYGNAIPTIVTDILMLALPAPYIWNLQLPRLQKLALAGIFLVGVFVTVVSVVRLRYLIQGTVETTDITWQFVDIALWSVVEGNVAILCACLPFLRPILTKLTSRVMSLKTLTPRQCHNSSSNTKSQSQGEVTVVRGWEGGLQYGVSSTQVQATSRAGDSDDHPIAQACDARSERCEPVRGVCSSIELQEMPPVGQTSPLDGILVTTEACMQHQPVLSGERH